jgi:hypothetical protein
METKIAKYANSNAFREAIRKRVDETELEIEGVRGEVAVTLGHVLSAQGIKPLQERRASPDELLAGELEKEFFMTGYLFVEMARELGFSAYVAGLVSTECMSFSASTLPDSDGNTEERTKDGDGVDAQLDDIFYDAAFKQVAEIEHTTTATKKPKVKKVKKVKKAKGTAA